jgi:phosphatidylinositol-3-phosphatase
VRLRASLAALLVAALALVLAWSAGASDAPARHASARHASARHASAPRAAAPLPPIRHVFVIVLENESASTTFGPTSPARYLSKTLTAQGAFLPNYYGVGHESNDNYIAMISGQAPSVSNQSDCQIYSDLEPGTMASYGQAVGSGCVYPSWVPTIASQLTTAGYTWRDYNEDMGADPARESSVCGHPGLNSRDNTQTAEASDMYATRHNPFVYFHSIIDDTTLCDTHVVNLDELPQDLSATSKTANYSFITPDLCDDGHDAPCADGEPGGLPSADKFLQTWVPQITSSPAFKQDGLLIVTFDEAATSDTSSCCGEIPGPNSPEPGVNGPGGGDVGAVLLSPCIKPGTVSQTPYNHYTMLGSVENLFGLAHLGYAALPGETYFGSDIFNQSCGSSAGSGGGGPPTAAIHAPVIASQSSTTSRLSLRWSATGHGDRFTIQVRDLSRPGSNWRTLMSKTTANRRMFSAALGQTYEFRVDATSGGLTSPDATATTIVPTGTRIAGGHFTTGWTVVRRRGAWQQHVIQTTRPGASLTLRYTGGFVSVIGDMTRHGGTMLVTVDGRSRTISLNAKRLHRRRVLCTVKVTSGVHHLKVTDMRGLVALEGLAIADRTG